MQAALQPRCCGVRGHKEHLYPEGRGIWKPPGAPPPSRSPAVLPGEVARLRGFQAGARAGEADEQGQEQRGSGASRPVVATADRWV